MGSVISTETETIEISGYVYAANLTEAKRLIYLDLGPGFELAQCVEKEYPIIII
jgi:hypothetical protein